MPKGERERERERERKKEREKERKKEREREKCFVRDSIKPWPLRICKQESGDLALCTILVQAYDNLKLSDKPKRKYQGGMTI
jgi:hypothetical protein